MTMTLYRTLGIGLAGLLAFLALAMYTPASAQTPPEQCGPDNIYYETFEGETFPLPIPSKGGCVSSYASGRLSNSAYAAQCKALEAEFLTYPYSFYDRYPAKNRADCIKILRGFHTGQLEPGPAPQ